MSEINNLNSHQQSEYPRPWLALAIGGFLLLYLLVGSLVLKRFANSGDEYAYLVQAKIFAAGRLWVPAPPKELRRAFALDHMVDRKGRRCSKYTPGWPLLLSLGESARMAWALNAVLGALTLFFVFRLTTLLIDRKTGWLALVFLGASPFFMFNSASYMSHSSSLLFQVLALYAAAHGLLHRSLGSCFLAGAAVGFAFLIRPLDSAVCGIALLSLARRSDWKLLLAALVGAIPVMVLFFVYNHLQFGGALITGYHKYSPTFSRHYGWKFTGGVGKLIPIPGLSASHLKSFGTHLEWFVDLARMILAGTWLLVPFGFWALRNPSTPGRRIATRFSVVLLVTLAIVTLFQMPLLGDAYGPRYLFSLLLPLALLVGAGAKLAIDRYWPTSMRKPLVAATVLIFALAFLHGLELGQFFHKRVNRRIKLFELVAEKRLKRTVVLLRHTDVYPAHWYTRNGINLQGSVVYAIDLGMKKNRRLLRYYPDYEFYQYRNVRTAGKKRQWTKKLVRYHFR